jgi:tRNA-specific 2-thiouridylase
MSGGVDSAVAAALLDRQGYEVIGVTLRLYTEPDETALRSGRTCCGIEDIGDARAAAQRIGIPHYVLNMEREFERDVIDYFVDEYAKGRTPNPCLACNQHVKFSTLLDRALAMGADRLATGHYARVEPPSDAPAVSGAPYRLHRAADPAKDQSYVLYTLGQDALERTLFPLGELTKDETRAIARELELPLADKPDSVDICFVPGGDYRRLLELRGLEDRPGVVESVDGEPLGEHRGVARYTVGQRRGLGVATGAPGYVTRIDAERNVIVIGGREHLERRELRASAPRWVHDPPIEGDRVYARLRYHGVEAPATVALVTNDALHLDFDRPVAAASPGQAVVLYDGSEVLGGATIEAS